MEDKEKDKNKYNFFFCPEHHSKHTFLLFNYKFLLQLSFDLIEAILMYINNLNQEGAVLVFLPGWNLIFALMKHLMQHRIFGDQSKFVILPLHSQIPRDDQKKVFVTPPPGITKVYIDLYSA
jgi:ATP-dependent RNA helicase A